MRILSLEVQDILSIHQASISFEDEGLVLVEGWNYDTNRANGAGKTALFNSLAFALYDKLPRKVTASEIVRRGCKSGSATARVLCGDDIWTVTRSRPKGVKFFKNDIEETITQAEFESKIRLSYDQFLLTIYTPQVNSGRANRFLSSPDTNKKEFLLKLLNLDQFSSAKKIVDESVSKVQAAIDLETRNITSCRARIGTYEEHLIDIDTATSQSQSINRKIALAQKEVDELLLVEKPDFSKYASTENGLMSKQQDIVQAKAKRTMLHDRYREVTSSIHAYDASATCTNCGSSLDTEEARNAHAEQQEKFKTKASLLKQQLDDVDAIIVQETSVSALVKQLRDIKQQGSEAYQAAQLRMSDLNGFLANQRMQLEHIQAKIQNNEEIQSKIDALQVYANKSLIALDGYRSELEIYKTLLTVYSPTGAQAYVLDSIVDSFNEVVQRYVDLLNPDMSYNLNSFKETSRGDVVAKFSETLVKNGQEVSVGSLSGGEEKGLSLCIDFALLDVLETQFGMRLNPIILDEPFDGLDSAGREIVVDLLEVLARNRQIMVIDHSSEAKSMFSKVIRIELRNGTSSIAS